jgi:hypothetical protein
MREAIWDSKGCDLKLNKGKNVWQITMKRFDQKEGKEHIVRIITDKKGPGNSVTVIQLDPALETLTRPRRGIKSVNSTMTTRAPPSSTTTLTTTTVKPQESDVLQKIWTLGTEWGRHNAETTSESKH